MSITYLKAGCGQAAADVSHTLCHAQTKLEIIATLSSQDQKSLLNSSSLSYCYVQAHIFGTL